MNSNRINEPSKLAVVHVQSRCIRITTQKEATKCVLPFIKHPGETDCPLSSLSDAFLFLASNEYKPTQFLLSHAWSDMLVKSV